MYTIIYSLLDWLQVWTELCSKNAERDNLSLCGASFLNAKRAAITKLICVHHSLYSVSDWLHVWTELCSENAERANLSLCSVPFYCLKSGKSSYVHHSL